jgi:phage gp36-like protein
VPYCSLADLQAAKSDKILGQLTTGSDISISGTIVSACIGMADGIINGHLSRRYAVPLASTPDLVKSISVDLTLSMLYERENGNPEEAKTRRERAIGLLEKVESGKLELGSAALDHPVTATEFHLYDETAFDPDETLEPDGRAGTTDYQTEIVFRRGDL